MIDQTVLAEIVAFVENCNFPCSKDDLVNRAEELNATDEVIDQLDKIPDRDYLSEMDVVETVQSVY